MTCTTHLQLLVRSQETQATPLIRIDTGFTKGHVDYMWVEDVSVDFNQVPISELFERGPVN